MATAAFFRASPLSPELSTPKYRGVSHVWAFFVFLFAGVALIVGSGYAWPAAAFVGGVVGLFGTSALYHRVRWSERWYPRIRRLDHAMIFALVLGTYCPLFAVALVEQGVEWEFGAVLVVSALGILLTLFWPSAPKFVRSIVYLTVGWMGIVVAPELWETTGPTGVLVLISGGVVYSFGALVYAFKWPDPWPRVFGYHEIFHACVIAAVAIHFGLVASIVL